jgi:adenine-specific DNA-methyltransferase
MKYMGSKRSMLQNGLGTLIDEAVVSHDRFVDLFTGSAAVAWHVAERYGIEVLAGDLQEYSVALANGVLARTDTVSEEVFADWLAEAETKIEAAKLGAALQLHDELQTVAIREIAERARQLCQLPGGPVFNAYGGYYFSPLQSIWLDALRATLPGGNARYAALSSLIWAASRCAAAPGHTAQPFKPNETAGRFVIEAWSRDVVAAARQAFSSIATRSAKVLGAAVRADALSLASELGEGDLVFLDPPYSGVHYSRFYHVLETLTQGDAVEVFGEGRYPHREKRPRSDYSVKQGASRALDELLARLGGARCTAILTVPSARTSNGLSGDLVKEIAERHFTISVEKVSSRFSTLGGNRQHREARLAAEELILYLRSN